MKSNMGGFDRILRLTAAAAIAVLLISGAVKGSLAFVLALIAVLFILTSIAGICPVYTPFRITTKKKPGGGSHPKRLDLI